MNRYAVVRKQAPAYAGPWLITRRLLQFRHSPMASASVTRTITVYEQE